MPKAVNLPYTVKELRGASAQQPDEYHRHLMAWAADEIDRLRARLLAIAQAAQQAAPQAAEETNA